MKATVVCVETPDFMMRMLGETAAVEREELVLVAAEARAGHTHDQIQVDVRDGVERAAQLVRARTARPAAVLTTQEMFLTQTAALARTLGVPGNSATAVAVSRDKARMKAAWLAAGVATPAGTFFRSAQAVADAAAGFDYPVIVKPSLGYASCGVRLVMSEVELHEHLRTVRLVNSTVVAKERLDNAGLLVETYIHGEEYSVDSVWFGGTAVCDGVLSKGAAAGPVYPDRLYHLDPALPPARRAELVRLSHQAVRAVGVRYGATHTEIRYRQGRPYVLETTSRPGAGGIFYRLFHEASGIDFTRAYYLSLVCRDRDEFTRRLSMRPGRSLDRNMHYFWYNLPHRGAGVIKEIRGLADLAQRPEVMLSLCYKKPGGVLYRDELNSDYFCSVLGRCDARSAPDFDLGEFVREYDTAVEVIF